MIRIESPNNEHFKRWKTLATPKGIRKEGEFILMGNKLIAEFMRDPGNWVIRAEIVTDQLDPFLPKPAGDLRRDNPRGPKIFSLSPGLFNEVDVLGTHANLMVLEAPQIPQADLSKKPVGLELVCPLGDPTNLGAVIRSALAFGVSRVILTEEACNPFHPKAVKASAGAVLRVPMVKTGSIRNYITGDSDYALALEGQKIGEFAWPKDLRLIVGEEGPGLPFLAGVKPLFIPTGQVESLNAAVAASLALFSWSQKR